MKSKMIKNIIIMSIIVFLVMHIFYLTDYNNKLKENIKNNEDEIISQLVELQKLKNNNFIIKEELDYLQQRNNNIEQENKILRDRYEDIKKTINGNHKQCELYNTYDEIYHEPVPNGVYWAGTDFYCVWAGDKTISQQKYIERHEYCHYLVNEDYNHYCNEITQSYAR